MPFTPSHAAAVLPLVGRRGLVPAALVIGSLAPDLPYYLQLGTESSLTHSLVGVVTVDLVMAFVVFVLWQGLVAQATYAAAPSALRARAATPPRLRARVGSAAAAGVVVVSLVLGGLTHVVWDTFTHEGRWGTEAIPWLTEQHGRLVGYRWLQYLSSALGLAIVAVYLAVWWRRAPKRVPATPALPRRAAVAFWVIVIGALVLGLVAGIVSGLAADVGMRRGVFRALVWGGGAGLLGLVVGSAAVTASYSRWSGEPPAVSDGPSAS